YFKLEKDCLDILKKNYQCTCSHQRQHFPTILKSDPQKFKFELTDQGTSIDVLISEHRKVKIADLEEQIDCIVSNLRRNRIRHLDIHDSGKNMCVDKSGNISLIDFDVATIGNQYLSDTLKERMERYGGYEQYFVNAKHKMLKMT